MQNRITPSSLFVVSGGARGITAQCVIRMAQRYRCKFILLGRSARTIPESAWVDGCQTEADMKKQVIAHLTRQGEKPTPVRVQKLVNAIRGQCEIDATLQTIAHTGSQAEYLSVNIADAGAVRAALCPVIERMGPVTGILHGAGVLADKLIEQKSLDDFENIYAVKVKGLENLLDCVPINQLDHLVLFASVAGFYGNVGQSDYALANEILNKVAHQVKRSHPACHVVAINWGPWDGGMVTPAIKELFAGRNMEVIPVDAGTDMLINELEAGAQASTQVVIGSPIVPPQSQLDSALHTLRIRRRLTLDANPFLHDHVIGDHAVLPTVVSIAWLTNACEQHCPGYTFFRCKDYKVLKGITFDEELASTYILDLKELAKDPNGEVVFEALIWSETSHGRKRYHYSGQIVLRRKLPAAPIYEPFDRSASYVIPGEQIYQDGTLFHGPSFRGVERVLNIGPEKLTMQCRLPIIPIEQQGQFPIQTFNPYQADIQYQCMLIWARHVYQAGSLPLRADVIEYFRSVTPGDQFWVSMDVQQSSETRLVARVTTHDEQGLVYMQVTGAEVTISPQLNHLFLASSRA